MTAALYLRPHALVPRAGVALFAFRHKPTFDLFFNPSDTVLTEPNRGWELAVSDEAADMDGVEADALSDGFDSQDLHVVSPITAVSE
jgi:hypothetical protein